MENRQMLLKSGRYASQISESTSSISSNSSPLIEEVMSSPAENEDYKHGTYESSATLQQRDGMGRLPEDDHDDSNPPMAMLPGQPITPGNLFRPPKNGHSNQHNNLHNQQSNQRPTGGPPFPTQYSPPPLHHNRPQYSPSTFDGFSNSSDQQQLIDMFRNTNLKRSKGHWGIKVEKLRKDKSNWAVFEWAMRTELMQCPLSSGLRRCPASSLSDSFSLWDIVESQSQPISLTEQEWNQANSICKLVFHANVHEVHFVRVLQIASAYMCWQSFKPRAGVKSTAKLIQKLRDLEVQSGDVMSYMDSMQVIYTRIQNCTLNGDVYYSEQNFLVDVVIGIAKHPSCTNLGERLFAAVDNPNFDVHILRAELESHQQYVENVDNTVDALYASSSNSSHRSNRKRNDRRRDNKPDPSDNSQSSSHLLCTHCGHIGHTPDNCYAKQNAMKRLEKNRKRTSSPSSPSATKSEPSDQDVKYQLVLHVDSVLGEKPIAIDDRLNESKISSFDNLPDSEIPSLSCEMSGDVSDQSSHSKTSGSKTALVSSEFISHSDSSAETKFELVVDSGCGQNVFNIPPSFFYNKQHTNSRLKALDGVCRQQPEFSGDVDAVLYGTPQPIYATLRNTLSVRHVCFNLMSVSASSTRSNVSFLFDSSAVTIRFPNGGSIMAPKSSGGLYQLRFRPLPPPAVPVLHTLQVDDGNDSPHGRVLSIHRSLGHRNLAILKKMVRIVERFSISPSLKRDVLNLQQLRCDDCLQAKARNNRQRSSREPYHAQEVGDMVYSDYIGPYRAQHGGFKHLIVHLDDVSDYVEVACAASTSAKEYLKVFTAFDQELFNRTGRHVRVLKADNGAQYTSSLLQDYCERSGVTQQFLEPHRHGGRIERANRDLDENGGANLSQSKLPYAFRMLAIQHCAFTRNVLPKGDSMTSSFELFYGTPPSTPALLPFGCLVRPVIPPNIRLRHQSRVEKAVLVGYARHTAKAYQVLRDNGRIVTRSQIHADPRRFPGLPRPADDEEE